MFDERTGRRQLEKAIDLLEDLIQECPETIGFNRAFDSIEEATKSLDTALALLEEAGPE